MKLPPDFKIEQGHLFFNQTDLYNLVETYKSPLRLTDLSLIAKQIETTQKFVAKLRSKLNYKGTYHYAYCTKAGHFDFILKTVLRSGADLEISSANDYYLLKYLAHQQVFKNQHIICNGYKNETYLNHILKLVKIPKIKVISVIDSISEFLFWEKWAAEGLTLGLRLALGNLSQSFKSSRFGIPIEEVESLMANSRLQGRLKLLHFFTGGLNGSPEYLSQLEEVLQLYKRLKSKYNWIDSLNLGGGLRVDYEGNRLAFADLTQIFSFVREFCTRHRLPHPHIFTEFGHFTLRPSGAMLYKIQGIKQQGEIWWYIIDDSFLTTLPDTWGLKVEFLLLPLNHWDKPLIDVRLGGMSCDEDDHYPPKNSCIKLPKIEAGDKPLYVGVFYSGAYQEALGGYNALKHCLMSPPKYLVIDQARKQYLIRAEVDEERVIDDLIRMKTTFR